MRNMPVKLPIGIENFEKIRTEGFYYIDKTGLIAELLHGWGKVNLFTRPRRFGKSLNMSMLKYFFEIGRDPSLFDGLQISEEKELCEQYMGKFPVISISLKAVSGMNFEAAKAMLRSVIGNEAMRFQFLLQSDKLTELEKKQYFTLVDLNERGSYSMPDEVLNNSLLLLSQLLYKHYGRKAVILIDEYDVPLDRAFQSGYYDAMVGQIRELFHQGLKSNDSMQLAVMTGCLRISKESIFTGLNNLRVLSITNASFGEHFGFTDQEVRGLLAYYGLEDFFDTTKAWYDGYRFGNNEVYCPWDVINYCADLRGNPSAQPQNYWANTSGNVIVKKLLQKATGATKRELEELLAGGSVKKAVRQELTYSDIDTSIENLWSMLFTTGYLTMRGEPDGDIFELVIPNQEIRKIFTTQVMKWFQEEAQKDSGRLERFGMAFRDGDAAAVEEQFNQYLKKTISIRDTAVRKDRKENFFHGILLGLLSHMEDWGVWSNAETGDGYSDILMMNEDEGIGIIIEVKYAEDGALDAACAKALQQIEDRRYEEELVDDGMDTILKYGIACYKKRCRVVKG